MLVTEPTIESGEAEFWVSEVVAVDEGDGGWGFSIYGEDKVFIAALNFADEGRARRAAVAMASVLKDAVFVGTERA